MDGGFEHLLAEGIISEVLARLKSGKEADVYIVRYGGKVVAAKVYKDRAMRSFKNNSAYKEGRSVRNSRSQRAMDRKTSFGQAASEAAWKTAEADALYKLHAADVRVPTPVMFLEGVLLMELVLDAEGEAAPRLIDTTLTIAQANAAYRDMLTQLVRILACDLIHGDLSPYNVLWAASGPTIIDFPQIVSASHNSSSEHFFLRDARNILGYFASIDRSLNARGGDAQEIWRAYVRRELTPDFVPLGRPQPFSHRPVRRLEAHPPPPHRGAPPPRPEVMHSRGGPPAPRPVRGPDAGPPPRGARSGPEVIVRINRSAPQPHGPQPVQPPPFAPRDVPRNAIHEVPRNAPRSGPHDRSRSAPTSAPRDAARRDVPPPEHSAARPERAETGEPRPSSGRRRRRRRSRS